MSIEGLLRAALAEEAGEAVTECGAADPAALYDGMAHADRTGRLRILGAIGGCSFALVSALVVTTATDIAGREEVETQFAAEPGHIQGPGNVQDATAEASPDTSVDASDASTTTVVEVTTTTAAPAPEAAVPAMFAYTEEQKQAIREYLAALREREEQASPAPNPGSYVPTTTVPVPTPTQPPTTIAFTAYQAYGSCDDAQPFDVFEGTAPVGATIVVKADLGNGQYHYQDRVVGADGTWRIEFLFPPDKTPFDTPLPVYVKMKVAGVWWPTWFTFSFTRLHPEGG